SRHRPRVRGRGRRRALRARPRVARAGGALARAARRRRSAFRARYRHAERAGPLPRHPGPEDLERAGERPRVPDAQTRNGSSGEDDAMTRRRTIAGAQTRRAPDTKSLLEQYGCGPIQFTGTADALYERHLLFDNVVDQPAVGARERYEAVTRSVRDVLSQRWVLADTEEDDF